MSVLRIADLYARSARPALAPLSGCWQWSGAQCSGSARIWTFDHDRGEKRPMSGPRAVWNISKGCGLGDRLAYMRCVNSMCVNPAHVASAADKAEIGANVVRVGKRKGTSLAQRRANIALAHAANGITVTPPDVVLEIRAADAGLTNVSLAARFGITHQTVSMIRRGWRRRDPREATR